MEASKANLASVDKAKVKALDKEDRVRWDTEGMSSAAITVVAVGVDGDGSSRGRFANSSRAL